MLAASYCKREFCPFVYFLLKKAVKCRRFESIYFNYLNQISLSKLKLELVRYFCTICETISL